MTIRAPLPASMIIPDLTPGESQAVDALREQGYLPLAVRGGVKAIVCLPSPAALILNPLQSGLGPVVAGYRAEPPPFAHYDATDKRSRFAELIDSRFDREGLNAYCQHFAKNGLHLDHPQGIRALLFGPESISEVLKSYAAAIGWQGAIDHLDSVGELASASLLDGTQLADNPSLYRATRELGAIPADKFRRLVIGFQLGSKPRPGLHFDTVREHGAGAILQAVSALSFGGLSSRAVDAANQARHAFIPVEGSAVGAAVARLLLHPVHKYNWQERPIIVPGSSGVEPVRYIDAKSARSLKRLWAHENHGLPEANLPSDIALLEYARDQDLFDRSLDVGSVIAGAKFSTTATQWPKLAGSSIALGPIKPCRLSWSVSKRQFDDFQLKLLHLRKIVVHLIGAGPDPGAIPSCAPTAAPSGHEISVDNLIL